MKLVVVLAVACVACGNVTMSSPLSTEDASSRHDVLVVERVVQEVGANYEAGEETVDSGVVTGPTDAGQDVDPVRADADAGDGLKAETEADPITGTWAWFFLNTAHGEMTIALAGKNISGSYSGMHSQAGGLAGTVAGSIDGDSVTLTFSSPLGGMAKAALGSDGTLKGDGTTSAIMRGGETFPAAMTGFLANNRH